MVIVHTDGANNNIISFQLQVAFLDRTRYNRTTEQMYGK